MLLPPTSSGGGARYPGGERHRFPSSRRHRNGQTKRAVMPSFSSCVVASLKRTITSDRLGPPPAPSRSPSRSYKRSIPACLSDRLLAPRSSWLFNFSPVHRSPFLDVFLRVAVYIILPPFDSNSRISASIPFLPADSCSFLRPGERFPHSFRPRPIAVVANTQAAAP